MITTPFPCFSVQQSLEGAWAVCGITVSKHYRAQEGLLAAGKLSGSNPVATKALETQTDQIRVEEKRRGLGGERRDNYAKPHILCLGQPPILSLGGGIPSPYLTPPFGGITNT